mmetsp:Transcript_26421/g.74346  ORF Transcript_26421/g.74346 Transcript_26421/m.74346 type:complete len:311 (+) Transcript_26421:377-1309(+)
MTFCGNIGKKFVVFLIDYQHVPDSASCFGVCTISEPLPSDAKVRQSHSNEEQRSQPTTTSNRQSKSWENHSTLFFHTTKHQQREADSNVHHGTGRHRVAGMESAAGNWVDVEEMLKELSAHSAVAWKHVATVLDGGPGVPSPCTVLPHTGGPAGRGQSHGIAAAWSLQPLPTESVVGDDYEDKSDGPSLQQLAAPYRTRSRMASWQGQSSRHPGDLESRSQQDQGTEGVHMSSAEVSKVFAKMQKNKHRYQEAQREVESDCDAEREEEKHSVAVVNSWQSLADFKGRQKSSVAKAQFNPTNLSNTKIVRW